VKNFFYIYAVSYDRPTIYVKAQAYKRTLKKNVVKE